MPDSPRPKLCKILNIRITVKLPLFLSKSPLTFLENVAYLAGIFEKLNPYVIINFFPLVPVPVQY